LEKKLTGKQMQNMLPWYDPQYCLAKSYSKNCFLYHRNVFCLFNIMHNVKACLLDLLCVYNFSLSFLEQRACYSTHILNVNFVQGIVEALWVLLKLSYLNLLHKTFFWVKKTCSHIKTGVLKTTPLGSDLDDLDHDHDHGVIT
jgi:hypothetical protein